MEGEVTVGYENGVAALSQDVFDEVVDHIIDDVGRLGITGGVEVMVVAGTSSEPVALLDDDQLDTPVVSQRPDLIDALA